jgi:hypothetical protein
MSTALTTQTATPAATQSALKPGFQSVEGYKLALKFSEAFASSTLVPMQYRANSANCMIAISMASRMNADPLTVMQNLHIIQGKPSFSAQFLIASWNACGRFAPIRYQWTEKRDGCRAISKDLETGEVLTGTLVTLAMAKAEGWFARTGSKWQTMPEQMLMYRAGTFLVRAYAAEIALGITTTEEAEDITGLTAVEPTSGDIQKLNAVAQERAKVQVIESSPEVAEVAEVIDVAPVVEQAAVVAAEITPSSPAEKAETAAEPTQDPSIIGTTLEGDSPVSKETLSYLGDLVKQINPPKEKWVATLQKKFGVTSAKELNENQAQAVVKWAKAQVEKKQLDDWAQGAGQKREASQEAAPFQTT